MGFSTLKTVAATAQLQALSMEQAKNQLGILPADDTFDAEVQNCVLAVQSYVENYAQTERIVFGEKSFEYITETHLTRIKLPKSRVNEVMSVQYRLKHSDAWTDLDFTTQIGDELAYISFDADDTILRQVRIEFKAGYKTAEEVPLHYKQGLLLILSDFWNLKDDSQEKQLYTIPHNAMRLFSQSWSLTA